MSQETTVRYFEFDGASAGPWVPGGAAMLVQSSVDVTVQAVTLIGQTPVDLGTVSAGSSAELSTKHAFVRLVSAGAGAASIAASMPVSTGAGGGGGSSATETTQLLVKSAVEEVNTKTPALESGRVPVALPAGLATEATLTAGAVSRWDQVALVSSDEATVGTVYLLYRPSKAGTGLLWGLKRIITAGASTEIRYAGPANNPSITDPWASRTTLVYGLPQEA